jgi:hypothetical protein
MKNSTKIAHKDRYLRHGVLKLTLKVSQDAITAKHFVKYGARHEITL